MQKPVLVDILGSCVSRLTFLDGDGSLKGCVDNDIKIKHFFDKNNIAASVMPAPFEKDEIDAIEESELWDHSRLRALKSCLSKDCVNLLLNSEASYLVLDFYDFQNDMACCGNTVFSTCAHEFFNTRLFKNHRNQTKILNFMNLDPCVWFPYTDIFFEKILKKFDSDHIILNRFRASSSYIDRQGVIKPIPAKFLQPYDANFKYNDGLRLLEEYIIKKYNPYVIDLSRYFITDEREWDNLNGAHFQKVFYKESHKSLRKILFNETKKRYFNRLGNKTVADILHSDLNDSEFEKYIEKIDRPFHSCKALDRACLQLDKTEIRDNRKFLGDLYLCAEKQKDALSDKLLGEQTEILINAVDPKWKNDAFANEFLEYMRSQRDLSDEELTANLKQILSELKASGDERCPFFADVIKNLENYR